jgi:hypothetical protein
MNGRCQKEVTNDMTREDATMIFRILLMASYNFGTVLP